MGRRATLAAAGAGALALALVAAPGASADDDAPEVVASDLNSPRHLTVTASGDLYVAESGLGGDTFVFAGAEGDMYFGLTGSITRVDLDSGVQERVLDGLPSMAALDGSAATGPTDVDLLGNGGQRYAITMGLAGPPDVRPVDLPGGELFGTVLTGTFASGPRVTADLAAFERTDPDGAGADSNPGGLVRVNGGYAVVDAGANTLLRAGANGRVSLLAVLPASTAAAPFPPFEIPVQSVPTSVTVGPDGAYYVSELTGFPFPAGGAHIWRVSAAGEVSAAAEGLTNVTDVAFDGSVLYAVQLSDGGLMSGEPGSLVRILEDGSVETVQGGLFMPYGLAIHDGAAYVTVGSVLPGGGEVIRVPLG